MGRKCLWKIAGLMEDLFLGSEGLLFVSFFWTSFHSLSSLTLGISLGEGFYLPDPFELTFANTLLLSNAAICLGNAFKRKKCLWKIAGLMEDLFLGSQWSIILGYRRLSVKFLFTSHFYFLLFSLSPC